MSIPAWVALVMAALTGRAVSQDRIVVDATRTIRPIPDRFLGLNVNYFLDDDKNTVANHGGNPARPLADAFKDMGVRRLRFPGGDKSNAHLWSKPPFEKPDPAVLKLGTGTKRHHQPNCLQCPLGLQERLQE